MPTLGNLLKWSDCARRYNIQLIELINMLTPKNSKYSNSKLMDTKETKDKKYGEALYDNIWDTINKDGACFERKITGMPSGAIVIFIAYVILKDSGLICVPVGIVGASFLSLCLITNMLSYIFGKITMMKDADTLRKYIDQSIPADLYGIAGKINREIDVWNWLSAIFLFLGIILTAIFIFINI
jgi:hypothetical protein